VEKRLGMVGRVTTFVHGRSLIYCPSAISIAVCTSASSTQLPNERRLYVLGLVRVESVKRALIVSVHVNLDFTRIAHVYIIVNRVLYSGKDGRCRSCMLMDFIYRRRQRRRQRNRKYWVRPILKKTDVEQTCTTRCIQV